MIAITGAAGFIGSNLAQRLAVDRADLLLVDHANFAGKLDNWVGLARFTFRDHETFVNELEGGTLTPRLVFHLGACSRTTETDWAYLERNNVAYSQRLWTWCAAARVPLLYASSAATYGNGSRGFSDRLHPRDLAPLNPYGRSKNEFDRFALDQVERGLPAPPGWAGLKFFNVYGPREAHKGSMASVVLHAWRQARATGQVRLFGSTHAGVPDGGQQRDFVAVEDCVEHLLWLARSPHEGGLYNSGTGVPRTFLDLARAVFRALALPERVQFFDMPSALRAQYQAYTCADMTRLIQAGFTGAATTLEGGVARYVAWLEAQARPPAES